MNYACNLTMLTRRKAAKGIRKWGNKKHINMNMKTGTTHLSIPPSYLKPVLTISVSHPIVTPWSMLLQTHTQKQINPPHTHTVTIRNTTSTQVFTINLFYFTKINIIYIFLVKFFLSFTQHIYLIIPKWKYLYTNIYI